ncbi:sensor domain-containing phosphodiesterase [Xanthomonas sp. Kuri4-1]
MVNALDVLDPDLGASLDPITRLAAFTFGVPVVMVTIVDADSQRFISKVGTELTRTDRRVSICAHAIETGDEILEVPDLSKDRRFADNPMVTGEPFMRFYAGAALRSPSGHALGTICLIGYEPRHLTADERRKLVTLAQVVMTHIELKLSVGRREAISGMSNRQQFQADLLTLAERRRGAELHAVLVDVMDLQSANEAGQVLGMAPMESLIRQAGQRLVTLLDGAAKVYHLSSTRFAFVLGGRTAGGLNELLMRLREGLREPLSAAGVPMSPLFHAGVVPFHADTTEAGDVVRKALIAVHAALSQGIPIAWYTRDRDDQLTRAYRLAADAEAGLLDGEFHLLYQPRVRLSDLRVRGVEALLRWDHPELGAVSPDEFIPVFEKTALMAVVSRWVMEHAIAQLGQWQAAAPQLQLSLNLSPRDFDNGSPAEELLALCAEHGVDPGRVEVEVTEGEWISNHRHALPQLRTMQGGGVRIAIDDFGSGYSNFGYLTELPISVIKLDRSLVSGIALAPTAALKAEAVIRLARRLGYSTVAEGVENLGDLRLLQEWGCDEGQGYLLARPMTPELALQLATGAALEFGPHPE